MIELDSRFFKNDDRVCENITKKRLEINPQTDFVVMDGEHMAGYLTVIPVSRSVFKQILKGSLSENEIEQSTIPYQQVGEYYCYLSSIIIDKEKYPFLRGEYFIKLFKNQIKRLRKRGIFIVELAAKAVSCSGENFLKRYGFKPIHKGFFTLKVINVNELFIREKALILCFNKYFSTGGVLFSETTFAGEDYDYRDKDT